MAKGHRLDTYKPRALRDRRSFKQQKQVTPHVLRPRSPLPLRLASKSPPEAPPLTAKPPKKHNIPAYRTRYQVRNSPEPIQLDFQFAVPVPRREKAVDTPDRVTQDKPLPPQLLDCADQMLAMAIAEQDNEKLSDVEMPAPPTTPDLSESVLLGASTAITAAVEEARLYLGGPTIADTENIPPIELPSAAEDTDSDADVRAYTQWFSSKEGQYSLELSGDEEDEVILPIAKKA